MHISPLVFAGALVLLLPTQVSAFVRGDFPGLPICSKLKSMPKGYKAIACDARAPLQGECRFTLSTSGLSIEYLIDDGVVLDKAITLGNIASLAAPYGLTRDDSHESAARKVKGHTGLPSQHWTDGDDETLSYLQSDQVTCGKNMSYTIYVWFRNDRAESVSVSTLPVI